MIMSRMAMCSLDRHRILSFGEASSIYIFVVIITYSYDILSNYQTASMEQSILPS